MANCKICGRPVPYGQTVHHACRVQVENELQEEFCGEHCRFPRSCDEQALSEHCATCRLLQLVELSREVSVREATP